MINLFALIIIILSIVGCSGENKETNLCNDTSMNTDLAMYSNDNLIVYSKCNNPEDIFSQCLIKRDKDNKEEIIDQGNGFSAVYIDGMDIYYSKLYENDISIMKVNENGEKEKLFDIENDRLGNADFLCCTNNKLYYYHDVMNGVLMQYDSVNGMVVLLEDISDCTILNDNIYYSTDNTLYRDTLQFNSQQKLISVEDIYASEQNVNYLKFMGTNFGIIDNISVEKNTVYFLLSNPSNPVSYNNAIYCYNIDSGEIKALFEDERVCRFQIRNGKIYFSGRDFSENTKGIFKSKLSEDNKKLVTEIKQGESFYVADKIYVIREDTSLELLPE